MFITNNMFKFMIMINLINNNKIIDNFNTKFLFSIYIGINQNLNKLQKFINLLFFISFTILIIATTSTTSSLLS